MCRPLLDFFGTLITVSSGSVTVSMHVGISCACWVRPPLRESFYQSTVFFVLIMGIIVQELRRTILETTSGICKADCRFEHGGKRYFCSVGIVRCIVPSNCSSYVWGCKKRRETGVSVDCRHVKLR